MFSMYMLYIPNHDSFFKIVILEKVFEKPFKNPIRTVP